MSSPIDLEIRLVPISLVHQDEIHFIPWEMRAVILAHRLLVPLDPGSVMSQPVCGSVTEHVLSKGRTRGLCWVSNVKNCSWFFEIVLLGIKMGFFFFFPPLISSVISQ